MIQPISFHYPIFDRGYDFTSEELTALELVGRLTEKFNKEIIPLVNTVDSRIAEKEDSKNITNKRLLSPTGNFTGTWMGKTLQPILIDINDSLSFSKTIIEMINNRESIGTIYDGGFFEETEPPVHSIEGGIF